ncbi:MAG: hypothetical protein CVU74_07140 [Deltaproteobacteria bacterium HGW-Deltaproteobacteria-9]|nr:MAG: hypothetical protein CVU74_07140 [Deltaproteobacteria bacterium HGW-Deltaproteobacteria-9]
MGTLSIFFEMIKMRIITENDLEKIESMIARHLGTFADAIHCKLDLVLEGQQMLSEQLDRWKDGCGTEYSNASNRS